jgi:hypothetical protein
MMAVGDSFLNGVVSATINDRLADLSVPAEVGRHLRPPAGFRAFRRATYPRPVLVDVHDLARTHIKGRDSLSALVSAAKALRAIRESVVANAQGWLADFNRQPDPTDGADNLAIAGARLPDVFSVTLRHVQARFAAMRAAVSSNPDPLAWGGTLPAGDPYLDDRGFPHQPLPPLGDPNLTMSDHWSVGDVHLAINALHLMRGCNELRRHPDMTVLDVVRARRPPILLMSMGPNHGLPDIALRTDLERCVARLERFADLWEDCAREIARLEGLRLFILCLLPTPSLIPALMGPQTGDTAAPPGPLTSSGHLPEYVSALALMQHRVLSGAEVEDADARVDAVRARIVETTRRVFAQERAKRRNLLDPRFIDLSAILARFDVKHGRGQPFVPNAASNHPPDRHGYDNRAIGERVGRQVRGGVCGYDHFHPTTLGYRFVAREVVEVIASAESALGMPGLVASRPLVTTLGDDVLANPHWPTLQLLTNAWPKAAASGHNPRTALSSGKGRVATRLLFNAGGCQGKL